jgi:hypothetical protein
MKADEETQMLRERYQDTNKQDACILATAAISDLEPHQEIPEYLKLAGMS